MSRIAGAVLLCVFASAHVVAAQDTSRAGGVRIGIAYRPGIRPGLLVLPAARNTQIDSLRAILTRDLDFSDRFEMITIPGGDSLRGGGIASRGGRAGASVVMALNYPLYTALGTEFVIEIGTMDSVLPVRLHDVQAQNVRREFLVTLPPVSSRDFRMSVHRLADQIIQAALGVPGVAATRLLFLNDGVLYRIDTDGHGLTALTARGKRALSPTWAPDGRSYVYVDFEEGRGRLKLVNAATEAETLVFGTNTALNFTPAFSPDGEMLTFARATEEGTDLFTVNLRRNCCLQRLTVGRFSDNLSPTYSPDGRRIAFVSTRPGLPQVYVMAADGTDQQLFAPFDYGVTGSSNAPEWSPDGQFVAFHRDVGGTLQVFVLDVRNRSVRQLTSTGRNEDPTWAPDSRHLCFISDRVGFRQLWVIDIETGRIRPLIAMSASRLPAWSPRLPEALSSNP
jgi:TolB protein